MEQSGVTISDILNDPLIRQMMRADRVSPRQMKSLLEDMVESINAADGRAHRARTRRIPHQPARSGRP
jgi:hypothetical protein